MDTVNPATRSRMMASVASKHTGIEMAVRRALHARGLRYRLHDRRLPGRPDIVLPGKRVVVFVNGCFWHSHTCPKGKVPASHTEFWLRKLEDNVTRFQRDENQLAGLGWKVFVVWECEVRGESWMERLVSALAQS